jgi:hypothetical protein
VNTKRTAKGIHATSCEQWTHNDQNERDSLRKIQSYSFCPLSNDESTGLSSHSQESSHPIQGGTEMKLTVKTMMMSAALLLAVNSYAAGGQQGQQQGAASSPGAGASATTDRGVDAPAGQPQEQGMQDEQAQMGQDQDAPAADPAKKQQAQKEQARVMQKMQKGTNYQVIEFQQGASQLTEAQRRNIRTLIDNARAAGPIEQIHVAVFADRELPPQQDAQLPQAQRDLVDQRISALESYMNESLQLDNVETYNMAERTNWFARAFNTDEAELRSLFAQEGAPQNVDPEEFRVVKAEGGAMKAVILIERGQQGQQEQPAGDRSPAASEGQGTGMQDQHGSQQGHGTQQGTTSPQEAPLGEEEGQGEAEEGTGSY